MSWKKKVLLIDDQPSVTNILAKLLARTDLYDVRTANTAAEAMEMARDFEPDLLVVDIIMPEMDGNELLARLRKNPKLSRTRAIFLTGLVGAHEISPGGHHAGSCPVLAKPVEAARLRDVVAEQLAS